MGGNAGGLSFSFRAFQRSHSVGMDDISRLPTAPASHASADK